LVLQGRRVSCFDIIIPMKHLFMFISWCWIDHLLIMCVDEFRVSVANIHCID